MYTLASPKALAAPMNALSSFLSGAIATAGDHDNLPHCQASRLPMYHASRYCLISSQHLSRRDQAVSGCALDQQLRDCVVSLGLVG